LVHILDQGSQFDAPLDVIWAYLESGHRDVHKSYRNLEAINISENTDLITVEEKIGRGWEKINYRVTELQPLGISTETLTGPMAGTKQFVYYTPHGDKTYVTVVGEFVSKGMTEDQLRILVKNRLQVIYEEDVIGIREFLERRVHSKS
jgi:hypothetical protein